MSPHTRSDLHELSLLDLFRLEAETQLAALNEGLVALENGAGAERLDALMRAAHSLKGAARMVGAQGVVRAAHLLEDCVVAAQRGTALSRAHIDTLLEAADVIGAWTRLDDAQLVSLDDERRARLDALETRFAALAQTQDLAATPAPRRGRAAAPGERHLRVAAARLARLTGLAGENLIEARRLRTFLKRQRQSKRRQLELSEVLSLLRLALADTPLPARAQELLAQAGRSATEAQQLRASGLMALEELDRRWGNIAERLYEEALTLRMRPFRDIVQALPRFARDLGRRLGKDVELELDGLDTPIDREVLEKILTPLKHLVQNAIDHGIETPEERAAGGKPPRATLSIAARHKKGVLLIDVGDDGRGIDVEEIRAVARARGLAAPELVDALNERELLEFLFLPGFTTRTHVNELSGRGVGLDVVHEAVHGLNGAVRVVTTPGQGTTFHLTLPLTLSLVRVLLTEVGGESYAFPLARITQVLKIPRQGPVPTRIELADGTAMPLVRAAVLFGARPRPRGEDWPVVVLRHGPTAHGVVVDRFLGERDLAVQPLQAELGKVQFVSAAAQLDDGTLTLIVDVDDVLAVAESQGHDADVAEAAPAGPEAKRILLVEDSLTVREAARAILAAHGYDVDVAGDGMEGWNALRAGHYHLVITDVDMPRMDGIELVSLIRQDARRRALPVMVFSYKGRAEDRRRGLDAGADYYFAKGDFDEAAFIAAVTELIGEAAA